MLELRKIHKMYKNGNMYIMALRDINVTFKPGEFVCVLGPSGGGKTTLLNIIGGLDYYTQNDLFVSGESLTGYRRSDLIIDGKSTKLFNDQDWDLYRSERVGFIFQNFNLLPNISVLDNVMLALTLGGESIERAKERAIKALHEVGLDELIEKKSYQLSTGQKQRVAIARAIVKDPDIILADEPTGALDPESRLEVMELIKRLAKDRLVIIVTHNQDLAYQYADRIIMLKDGEIVEDTKPANPTKEALPYEHENRTVNFFTSLKLALKNLKSRFTKTIVASIAGSIGIAGVALVMAISSGFGNEIEQIETETLSAMPISITTNVSNVNTLPLFSGSGYIYNYTKEFNLVPSYNNQHSNVITPTYLDYLDDIDPDTIDAIQYNFGTRMTFVREEDGIIYNSTDYDVQFENLQSSPTYLKSQYSLEAGRYPENENEIVIIVDVFNNLDAQILDFLGVSGNRIEFEDVIGKELRLALNDDMAITYDPILAALNRTIDQATYDNGVPLTITGVLKGKSNGLETRTFGIFYQDTLERLYVEDSQTSTLCTFLEGYDRSGLSLVQNTEFIKVRRGYGCNSLPILINIYPRNLDEKSAVLNYLNAYNLDLDDNQKILYTDLAITVTGVLSTISTNVNLILFFIASISLFISLMMIAILIYVGLNERTKEIGILRSLGARKRDIAMIFNLETIIIGFFAGFLGILFTFLISFPLNNFFNTVLEGFINVVNLRWFHAIILMTLSMSLTFITGFFPSRVASKKHPAEALKYNE